MLELRTLDPLGVFLALAEGGNWNSERKHEFFMIVSN
jgi:hypothetical protein